MSPTWSTTSTTQRFIQRSSRMNPPSYSFDMELDDELIRKELSSPLFTQEREEPANLRQTDHSHEESLLPAQSFFRTQVREDPCANQVQICLKNGNQVATWKTSKSGFSLKDAKSKFLLKPDLRSRSTNFKPTLKEEGFRNYLELLISATGNWSYYYTVWATQERSITTQRRKTRTKSGSPWNLHQEYARHWRIAVKSRGKVRGTFKKKIDWKLWGSNLFFQARMSRQSTSLATMTPSTHMLRLTTSTPGNRWLHHCTFRSDKFVTRKRES